MTPEHETWIDLLVDGELDERRRRELLLALEASPDGWRRCALAFLEAQTWGQALRGRTVEHAPPVVVPAAAPAHVVRRPAWGALLTLAASVALAFAAGHWWRGATSANLQRGDYALVGRSAPAPATSANVSPPAEASPSLNGAQLVSLELADDQGRGRHTVQLPVFDEARGREAWLAQAEATGPSPEVLAELERRGHRVSERRQLVPVRLGDGRELIVPVKEVEVQLKGAPVYQ
ncbi:MAG: hypothetical protein U0836_17865 [Pirellulales bacterium]